MLHEAGRQHRATENEELFARLPLQRGQLVDIPQQPGVRPLRLRLIEGPRNHVLRGAVHPPGHHRVCLDGLLGRPVLGHAGVGRAAEDEAVACVQLLDREVVELVVHVVPVDLPRLLALEVAVEGHHQEGRQLPHRYAAASHSAPATSACSTGFARRSQAATASVTTTTPAATSHAKW